MRWQASRRDQAGRQASRARNRWPGRAQGRQSAARARGGVSTCDKDASEIGRKRSGWEGVVGGQGRSGTRALPSMLGLWPTSRPACSPAGAAVPSFKNGRGPSPPSSAGRALLWPPLQLRAPPCPEPPRRVAARPSRARARPGMKARHRPPVAPRRKQLRHPRICDLESGTLALGSCGPAPALVLGAPGGRR